MSDGFCKFLDGLRKELNSLWKVLDCLGNVSELDGVGGLARYSVHSTATAL